MSKRKSVSRRARTFTTKVTAVPSASPVTPVGTGWKLDVGKAHADLVLALEEHRVAAEAAAEAAKCEAVKLDEVSAAQQTFDDAVEQARSKAAPFNSSWWNDGRRSVSNSTGV